MLETSTDLALALLRLMDRLGNGNVRFVLGEFEKEYGEMLHPNLRQHNSDDTPKWETNVRFSKSDWIQLGLMAKGSFGYWQISDAGRVWLREHNDPADAVRAFRDLMRTKNHTGQGKINSPKTPKSKMARPRAVPKNSKTEPQNNHRLHQLLDQKISEIYDFLAGRAIRTPKDEELCDWIQLCYLFELHGEGQQLFSFIQAELLNNDWLYRRTKRYADLCRLKAQPKG